MIVKKKAHIEFDLAIPEDATNYRAFLNIKNTYKAISIFKEELDARVKSIKDHRAEKMNEGGATYSTDFGTDVEEVADQYMKIMGQYGVTF